MPQWIFRIVEPGAAVREIQVEDGITFGRASDNRIVLGDGTVGQHHLRVINDKGRLVIEDLGSANGTQVHEGPTLRQGQRHIVHGGLQFRMGKTTVTASEGRIAAESAATVPLSGDLDETVRPGAARAPRAAMAVDEEDMRTVVKGAAPGTKPPPSPDEVGTVRKGAPPRATPAPPAADDMSTVRQGAPPRATPAPPAPDEMGTVRPGAASSRTETPEDEMATRARVESGAAESAGADVVFKPATLPPRPASAKPESSRERTPQAEMPETDAHSRRPSVREATISPASAEEEAVWLEMLLPLRPRLVVVSKGMKKIHDVRHVRMIVGRSAEADCYLEHPTVSAEHASLAFDGKAFRVVNLSQTNVTQVASAELRAGERAVLTPPVRLAFGAIEALFLVDESDAASQAAISEQAARLLVKEGKLTAAQVREAEQRARADRRQLGEMLLFQTGLRIDDWVQAVERSRGRRRSSGGPWLAIMVLILLLALGALGYFLWVRPR